MIEDEIDPEKISTVEIEQDLLGAILCQPDLLPKIVGILEKKHFYEPLHGKIYDIILCLDKEGRRSTPVLIGQYLKSETPFENGLTIPQYLGRLAAGVTHLAAVRDHAQTIREFYYRRAGIVMYRDFLRRVADPQQKILSLFSEHIQEMGDVVASANIGRLSRMSLGDAANKLISSLNDGNREKPITTGMRDLDRVIGGWRRGEYSIIAARPSAGKSAFSSVAMLNAAKAGHNVMMFSLEMTKEAVSARCLSSVIYNSTTPIPYADILNEKINDHDKYRIQEAARKLGQYNIEIDDQGGLTVSEISSRARQQATKLAKDGKRLDLIIIDHLGKVRASGRYSGNIVSETGEISNDLACMAKDLNVAMLVLHQLNRGVEGREDKHPQLSDLRNSGDIEQDADLVGFIYRPAYYLERIKFDDVDQESKRLEKLEKRKNDFEVIIAKQRNGPCITVELYTEMASNVIRDKTRI